MQEIRKENIKSSFEFMKHMFTVDYELVPAKKSGRNIYMFAAILLISGGLPFLVNSIEKYNEPSTTGIVLIILALVALYMFIFHKRIMIKKNAERAFLSQRQGMFIMNGEGINSYHSKNGVEENIQTKWADMAGYYHNENLILLYSNSKGFNYFDLNNYSTEERKVLLDWIKASVAPVQVIINAVSETEKLNRSGANAFIAPPSKGSAVFILIFSALVIIFIIVSYFMRFRT